MEIYLLIALFINTGVPEVQHTEVRGDQKACEYAATLAIPPIVELVGEKNLLHVTCVKKGSVKPTKRS